MQRLIVLLTIVVVSAAAGGASAAVLVGGEQVKDGSLRGRDVARSTIRSVDVRDDSLTRRDFQVSPVGPQGVQGEDGDPGDRGPHGLVAHREFQEVPGNTVSDVEIDCPDGKLPIYGGMRPANQFPSLAHSAPTIDGDKWVFKVRNPAATQFIEFYVTCATDR